jgi:hypothetical protein
MLSISFINNICDFIAAPFSSFEPVVGLSIVSFISAVALLYIFKKLSDQDKIKFHKNKIFGHFLEIALFRDQFRRTMGCQGQILKHNFIYLRYVLFPLLVMMPPVLLICLQLDFRLGAEPFKQDSTFIIQTQLDKTIIDDLPSIITNIQIKHSENITLETPAMRSNSEASVFWRANINDLAGNHYIQVGTNNSDDIITKNIAVISSQTRFSQDKRKIVSFSDNFLTSETNIPNSSIFSKIRVNYSSAEYPLLWWNFTPIVYYFILTLIFGLLIKPFIKVNI